MGHPTPAERIIGVVPISDIDARGCWWLPGRDDKRAHGTLHGDSSGLTLIVDGPLDPILPAPAPQSSYGQNFVSYQVILGDTDQGFFTLLNVQGMRLGIPESPDVGMTERYTVWAAIEAPIPAVEHQPKYGFLSFSTDSIVDWIRPQGPQVTPSEDGIRSVTVRNRQDVCRVELPMGRVELCGYGSTTYRSPYSVTLDTNVAWLVTPAKPAGLDDLIREWVGPLHNLVSFATLRPSRVTEIHIGETEDTRPARVHIKLRGDELPEFTTSDVLVRNLVLPASLMCAKGDTIVDGWMTLSEKVPTVIARLLGREYVTPIVLEPYVSSVVQAAEGLHKVLWDHTPLSREDHRERVEACVSLIPNEEHRVWAKAVLSSSNSLSLRNRLCELVEHARKAGCPFLPVDTVAFCRELVDYRNAVSHCKHANAEAVDIYWQASGLAWVLRAVILGQIGVTSQEVHDQLCVDRQWQYVVHKLGWSNNNG